MKTLFIALIMIFSTTIYAKDFKDCTKLKEQCFTLHNSPEKAFVLKAQTNKTAILVHGLSDSPYFTKDLALILNAQGYNVYSVLLTGHGSHVDETLTIKAESWLEDIKETIDQALQETSAEKVVLGGFSLGGVLVSSFAEDKFWKDKVSSLILLAPAFQIKKNMGRLMCATGAAAMKLWAWDKPEISPVKYNKMAFNAVCELTRLGAAVKDSVQLIDVPVFMAVTDGDLTINTQAAIKTFDNIGSAKKEIFHIQDTNILHSDINFKIDPIDHRENPQFDEMARKIVQFLQ